MGITYINPFQVRCDSSEDGDNAMMSVIEEVPEDESLESEEVRRQLEEQKGVIGTRRVSEDSSSRSTVDSSNTGSDTEVSSIQGWNVTYLSNDY